MILEQTKNDISLFDQIPNAFHCALPLQPQPEGGLHGKPYLKELAEAALHEVLVAVRLVGICGPDVHDMSCATGRRIPPLVMGHEASGDVVKTGRAVDTVWRGKWITFETQEPTGGA